MKSLLTVCSFVTFAALSGCSSSEGNMKAMSAMKDSIFVAYPQVASVTMDVKDGSDLQIALGSESLYTSDSSVRKQVAGELRDMALRIFGKETRIQSGRVLITQNETNQAVDPKDALVESMQFGK